MKNIFTIIKKELLRVFKDKTLIIALLIPGLLVYVIYSIMGSSMANSNKSNMEATFNVISYNMPSAVLETFNLDELSFKADYQELDKSALEDKKTLLKDGEIDLIIIFADDFEQKIQSGKSGGVTVYYNPSESRSVYAYEKATAGLEIYRYVVMAIRGDNNVVDQVAEPVMDERAAIASVFSKMIPFLIITFLFSGCMSVAPDSIAGEKERGTIATVLITPIKRSQLAIGKVTALGILASLSALSSFLGLMLSLPSLMGSSAGMSTYGFLEYALILLVLLTAVLLIVGVMAILSSFAKTVKEASMLIMPFMFVSMLIGLVTFIGDGAMTNPLIYLVPLLNTVQSLTSILSFDVIPLNMVLCVVSNILYVGASVLILAKLFNNEKIMFAK